MKTGPRSASYLRGFLGTSNDAGRTFPLPLKPWPSLPSRGVLLPRGGHFSAPSFQNGVFRTRRQNALLFQQGDKAGLLEMMVDRQCLGNARALHDGKGNAIRQRPYLVRALLIKSDSLPPGSLGTGDNGHVGVGLQQFQGATE